MSKSGLVGVGGSLGGVWAGTNHSNQRKLKRNAQIVLFSVELPRVGGPDLSKRGLWRFGDDAVARELVADSVLGFECGHRVRKEERRKANPPDVHDFAEKQTHLLLSFVGCEPP